MSIQNRKSSGISRVIKQGTHFICGLCGTRYTQNAAAEACLRTCAAKLNPEGVSASAAPPGDKNQTYRCTYCKRTYENFEEAKNCAKTCHAKMQKKLESESQAKTVKVSEEKLRALSQLAGENASTLIPPPNARKDSLTREDKRADETLARKKTVPPPSQTPATREKVQRPSPASAPQAPALQKSPTRTTVPPAESLPPAREDGAAEGEGTVYSREANKFRCLGCRKLHNSRKEVYACFESHEEQKQDSFEISLDPTIDTPAVQARAPRANKPVEEDAADLIGKDPNRVRSVAAKSEADKYFRDGARYGCRACKKKYFTKPEVIACFDSHGDDEVAELASPPPAPAPAQTKPTKAPSPAPSGQKEPSKDLASPPAKPAGEKISNEQLVDAILESAMREIRPSTPASKDGAKESDEKFYRNGAKYVCKKCGAKYFTKEDVISCFDRHS